MTQEQKQGLIRHLEAKIALLESSLKVELDAYQRKQLMHKWKVETVALNNLKYS